MAQCIDLKASFGRRYKVTWEDSYFAGYGAHANREDPWLQIIPGARGHVFPFDATRLAASTATAGTTAKKLKSLPGVMVWQDGSDGAVVLFHPDVLDQVAELLRLRRRRRLSEAGRLQLARASAATRFKPCAHGVEVHSEALVCDGRA